MGERKVASRVELLGLFRTIFVRLLRNSEEN